MTNIIAGKIFDTYLNDKFLGNNSFDLCDKLLSTFLILKINLTLVNDFLGYNLFDLCDKLLLIYSFFRTNLYLVYKFL